MPRFLSRLFCIGTLSLACAGLFSVAAAEDAMPRASSGAAAGSSKDYGKTPSPNRAAPEVRPASRLSEVGSAPEPLPARGSLVMNEADALPAPEVKTQLDRIEQMQGKIQAISAEFDQVRVSKEFGDETKSHGKLQIKKPNKLRCEYMNPEPSVLMFTSNTLYQHTPTLKQVDKFVYRTEQDADEFFQTLTLSFGLSSQKILDTYRVAVVKKDAENAPAGTFGLSFFPKPQRSDAVKDYSEIRVFFSESEVLPVRVRLYQTSGDETTLEIQNLQRNPDMPDKIFAPEFPRGTEVIEH